MRPFADRLRDEVGVGPADGQHLASICAKEARIYLRSPLDDPLLGRRLQVLEDHQIWRSLPAVRRLSGEPGRAPGGIPTERIQNTVIEMLAIVDLYVSMAYLSDSVFDKISSSTPENTVLNHCARFIRRDAMRALRNAFAHGNWDFHQDGGLRYWDRARASDAGSLKEWELCPAEAVEFILALTRCVGWVVLLECSGNTPSGIQ